VIVLIQRVRQARVVVDGETVGEIGQGLLAFLGLQKEDTPKSVENALERMLSYRVFADSDDKMNLSVRDIKGGLLLVSQFTLAADTRRGLRPSFSSAMDPREAERLYDHMVELARAKHDDVASGRFAADMQVELVNDGPVTFIL